MASITDTSLTTKLESSDVAGIHSLYFDYLIPFRDLTNPKKKTSKQATLTLTRSLAKQFLPFLNRSLSILPKRLSVPSDGENKQFADELFDVYKLCLNCLESVSSQLSCKPYTVSLQRLRLVYCLEACGRYSEGETEAFGILNRFRCLDLGMKKWGKFLPCVVTNGDGELAALVVELVVVIVKCLGTGKSKDVEDYVKVVELVEEVRPWFRVLDAKSYEKLHRMLVTFLGKSTQFLFAELTQLNTDVTCKFCVTTLTEHANSSTKDQIHKFSRRICSSLFSQSENNPAFRVELLLCVLDFVAHECKSAGEASEIEFLELVYYCASKTRAAGTVFSSALAACLNGLSQQFCEVTAPIDLILRFYATGLSLTDYVLSPKGGRSTSFAAGEKDNRLIAMLDDEEGQQSLTILTGSLQKYFGVSYKDSWDSSSLCPNGSARKKCSEVVSNHEVSMASWKKSKTAYLAAYLNALRFFCQPLADLVHAEKKEIMDQNGNPFSTNRYGVQDAFSQLCEVTLFSYSERSEKEKNALDDDKTILVVAVATLILSIRTKVYLQKSVQLVKHVIASAWIQPQGLQYLFTSLYNIGVQLFRNNQLKEASKALKLSCQASWSCVTLRCQISVDQSKISDGDASVDAIANFVVDICTRSAFLVDVLCQHSWHKVNKTIVYCLENWSLAKNLLRTLPSPSPLVKQWVKVQCRFLKSNGMKDSAQTLYHLLSSSMKVTKDAISVILEQELLAWEEVNATYPDLCPMMQTEILDILLQNVYVTRDVLQKSRALIRKGRILRASGVEDLKSCIQFLSEAISIINDMYGGDKCCMQSCVCHQLAVAYCLRALCIQEAEPNSKLVFEDINAALKLWLQVPVLDYGVTHTEGNIVPQNTMMLLYNVIDLLGMKGSMVCYHDIFRLMVRLFKWKNTTHEKCLTILWESRRLSHALCVSPIDDAFITLLSEHYGEPCKSVAFWMSCLKQSQPSLVGFQQVLSFFGNNLPCVSYNHDECFQSDFINSTKEAALELTSQVPTTSKSVFLAGLLYYDLCERLISNGRLLQALSCAKEAHRLRTKLFQEKFIYSVDDHVEKCEDSNRPQKYVHLHRNLKVLRSAATEIWSFDTVLWDVEGFYLSTWKVLQCYLESTLQVGSVQEMLGNSVEAETFLLWGKDISHSQSLPLFEASFSSILGKLHFKKQHWEQSDKELQSAKSSLVDRAVYSCSKCKLMLEITVDQQLGDLFQNHVDTSMENASQDRLSNAKKLYQAALDQLNMSEWKTYVSCSKEASTEIKMVDELKDLEIVGHSSKLQPNSRDKVSKKEILKEKKEVQKCQKAKNVSRSLLKEQASIPENSRITRSRSQFSQNQQTVITRDRETGLTKQLMSCNESTFSNLVNQNEADPPVKRSMMNIRCICNKSNCWFCLVKEVMASGLVIDFINLKWEFVRRRLSLRILAGIGKCLADSKDIHKSHETVMQSISLLVMRNPSCNICSDVHTNLLLDLAGKEFSDDVFAIERASVLYNLCWFSLKGHTYRDSGMNCCVLFGVQLPKVVSWLKLAFVLCREVPELFQKVSRLLAAVYVISSSNGHFVSSSSKILSESHWASYFHQASLGTQLNHQISSSMNERSKALYLEDAKGLHPSASACLRLAPDSVQDLEQFVRDFFAVLPCTTIVCMSLLGGLCASLLQQLLHFPAHVQAWVLLSRMKSKCQPIVTLIPVDSVLDGNLRSLTWIKALEDDVNSGTREFLGSKDPSKHWHCPWGSTIVDEVAPMFKLLLEENYNSSSTIPLEDTKENRSLWWNCRKKLDYRLSNFLRNLEETWLGPWSFMLLGEWSNHNILDMVHKKLMRDLKTKCKMDVNEDFLKVIIGGARHALEGEISASSLCAMEGCYIGKTGCSDEVRNDKLPNNSDSARKQSELAIHLLRDAIDELEEDEHEKREPIILVPGWEMQMLPWENLPVIRKQEVYRMPSIASILMTLEKTRCDFQPKIESLSTAFPSIDPLDAFYLLNPSGDLSSTQVEFENWFADQNLKGKAGSAPTAEELALDLKSHDLFIYLGHGSGAQYIPAREIQELEICAATLLMGCSSGCLLLNGSYTPQGTPLSYLHAGSPVIVANLWEVTDKDINRFGKAMLDAWLKERSLAESESVVKELEGLSIRSRKDKCKKKLTKKRSSQDSLCINDNADNRPKVGSFMAQAREACTLPFLIGAAPVCYGIPTGIRRKDL